MAHEQSQIVQNFVPLSLAIPPPNIKDPIDKLISSDVMNNFEKPITKFLVLLMLYHLTNHVGNMALESP
jgi:hypothetical protein